MIHLDGQSLTLEQVVAVARQGEPVALTEEAKERVHESRRLVEQMVEQEAVVYGITTGFGKFADTYIDKDASEELQRNLIVSHACGVGDPLPQEVVRAAMLLRANSLAKGFSGIRLQTIQLLLDMLNAGVIPVVPSQGSLGASGDLAPLSHIALVLLGAGEAVYQSKQLDGGDALAAAGLSPIRLSSKEGLALINGTQVMLALLCLAVHDAHVLQQSALITASLTVQALRGIPKAFDPRVSRVRPHPGQVLTAEALRRLLEGSSLTTRPGQIRVQDAYALRCLPQVHGAVYNSWRHVFEIVQTEINSTTDNPLIFAEDGETISAGNFHGEPLALPADYLAIAVAELADIAERRVERLVNPQLSGLPAFLTQQGGLNSGFMIAQYTAASLVSENKVLAHPASVDSIPSSANQEDHVSMGTIAARKLRQVVANTGRVLGIEYLAACQAIDLSGDGELSPATAPAYHLLRQQIPPLAEDRVMYPDINHAAALITTGKLLQTVPLANLPAAGVEV
ncbi:MAG: histidine ammonia-lyase [Bacillota bacterium]|jgi:histidine ammonia-lyase